MGLREKIFGKKAEGLHGIINNHARNQKIIALAIAIPTVITHAAMWINGYHPLFDPRDNLLCFIIYGWCAKLYNDGRKAEQVQEVKYQSYVLEGKRLGIDIEK